MKLIPLNKNCYKPKCQTLGSYFVILFKLVIQIKDKKREVQVMQSGVQTLPQGRPVWRACMGANSRLTVECEEGPTLHKLQEIIFTQIHSITIWPCLLLFHLKLKRKLWCWFSKLTRRGDNYILSLPEKFFLTNNTNRNVFLKAGQVIESQWRPEENCMEKWNPYG